MKTECINVIRQHAASAQGQNLFEEDLLSNHIYEFTPNGGSSILPSGLDVPTFLAFQGITLPVPEPSAWALVGIGLFALLVFRRRKA